MLDPFAGTGTFALVAARFGRRVLACERDDKMLAIAAKRGCVIEDWRAKATGGHRERMPRESGRPVM